MNYFVIIQLALLVVCIESRYYQGSEPQCRDASDCGPFQCCLDRLALAGGPSGQGECVSQGGVGSICGVGQQSGSIPLPPVLNCPCKRGLVCRPTGRISFEGGEQGICAVPRRY